jgi:uncharacterized protein (DUF1778 family)
MAMAEKTERLDLRLSPEHKRLVERAAAVTVHVSASGFAAVVLVEAARAALEQSETLTLSTRDWNRFTAILDAAEPNDALSAAATAYRGKHGP